MKIGRGWADDPWVEKTRRGFLAIVGETERRGRTADAALRAALDGELRRLTNEVSDFNAHADRLKTWLLQNQGWSKKVSTWDHGDIDITKGAMSKAFRDYRSKCDGCGQLAFGGVGFYSKSKKRDVYYCMRSACFKKGSWGLDHDTVQDTTTRRSRRRRR